MQSAIHAASSPRLHAVCGQSTAGGWSIWPAAWSISPAAVSSSSIRSKAVPDSAARGEIGGAPRTLQRAQKSARPSDFARGSTGPLGGGQRAARRQGGLERGGCLGWLLVGADNRERDGTGEGDALHLGQQDAYHQGLFVSQLTNKHTNTLRGAVMPHNRRSRPRTPYDTRQAPIAWPWRRCGSPRAESDLCRVAFSYIQPSQRRIRPLPRQSFPAPNSAAAAAICARPASSRFTCT